MRALIFGGTGQDGQYLRGLLEGKSITVLSCGRHGGDFLVDVSDAIAARNVIREVKPDFIFHLAATSSTAHEHLWANHAAIGTGTLAILDAVDRDLPDTKVLLAGSGLQFVNEGLPLDEMAPLDHSSPYVIARNYSLFAARYYRSRGRKVYFAYLFNHDSPLRSNRHLNMKIAEAAAFAASGGDQRLSIGDMNAENEFNFAGDVTAALWQLISQDSIYECVIGSGETHSVREWVELCYRYVGIDWKKYVDSDANYRSPYKRLVSAPAKLLSLGWQPSMELRQLAEIMMQEAIRRSDNAICSFANTPITGKE